MELIISEGTVELIISEGTVRVCANSNVNVHRFEVPGNFSIRVDGGRIDGDITREQARILSQLLQQALTIYARAFDAVES